MIRRWDVHVERNIDGVPIEKTIRNLSGPEVLTMRIEESCYPGELLAFERIPTAPTRVKA